MVKTTFVMGALCLFVMQARAEGPGKYFSGVPKVDFFSGTLRVPADSVEEDLQSAIDTVSVATELVPSEADQYKSPWLASAMSIALPGAGEFYSESYVKSAIFFVAEVTGLIVAYSYDKRGDRQTKDYKNYADLRWSVVRYAAFLGAPYDPNPNLQPWERVNWDTLNQYERQAGRGFTHTLPPYGEQQYYELIGKYSQYSPGWDDYNGEMSDGIPVPTRNFLDYAKMRGKANDYYNIASTAVSILVVNHVISAVDAYFTTTRYNKSFRAEARMHLRHTPFGPVAETVGSVSYWW